MEGKKPHPYDLLTFEEGALYAHISPGHLGNLVRRGEIAVTKIKNKSFVRPIDIDSYRLNKYSPEKRLSQGHQVWDMEQGRLSVSYACRIITHCLKTQCGSEIRPVSTVKLYNMIADGSLKAQRLGKYWVLLAEDVQEYIEHEIERYSQQLRFA